VKTIEELRQDEENAMMAWDEAIAEKNAANEKIKICRDRYEKARLAWIKERNRQDTKRTQRAVDK